MTVEMEIGIDMPPFAPSVSSQCVMVSLRLFKGLFEGRRGRRVSFWFIILSDLDFVVIISARSPEGMGMRMPIPPATSVN
jgi:hypothetical protein